MTNTLAEAAERSVLGGIMLNCEALPPGLGMLCPGDFANPLHAAVFTAMQDLHARREPIDLTTVHAAVKNDGSTPRQGWAVFLSQLTDEAVTAANVEHHARIVRREARRRDALSVADTMAKELRHEDADADQILTRAMTQLGTLAAGRELTRSVAMRELVLQRVKEIERRGAEGVPPGLPTGYPDIDRVLGGLCPATLVLLAARPSMGKSALMRDIVKHVVTRQQKSALVFSFEMTRDEQADGMLASEARCDTHRMKLGKPSADEWDRLAVAAQRLHTDRLHIVDCAAMPIDELRSFARAHAARHPLDLIAVDYLQLMDGDGDNREQVVASISRGLKALAMELRVPVLALAQLSRAVENRADKRPMLSDLRESGSLEQDASQVLMLYRDEYYDPDTDEPGICEVGIAKNRGGRTGMVKLRWTGQFTRFDSLEEDHPNLPYGAQQEISS